jgi:hypothetical protein
MIPWSIPIPNLLPVGVHALCVDANLFEPFRPGTLKRELQHARARALIWDQDPE